MKIYLFLICLAAGVFGYTPPLGIPNPADSMGFDPLNISRPDPTTKCPGWPNVSSKANGNDCDCYYVDNDAAGATDAANTYGYPNKPRLTVPNSPGVNSYVEIHGGNNYTGSFRPTGKGRADSLIWFVGKEHPVFTVLCDIGFSNNDTIQYMIFDSLTIHSSSVVDLRPRYADNHFSNIVFRNCELYGNAATADISGVMVGTSSASSPANAEVKNTVIYKCKIHSFGDKTAPGEECCVYVNPNTHSTWILNNEIYDAAEDGCSGAHVGYQTVYGFFVGDNYIHDNLVNGCDFKQDYDCIIAHNYFKNHWGVTDNTESPGQAIVLHYGGTSDPLYKRSPYSVFVINNIIDGARQGIATSEMHNLVVTGNVIRNIVHDPNQTNPLLIYNPNNFNNFGDAIHLKTILGNCIIERNSISKCDGGIKVPLPMAAYSAGATYMRCSSTLPSYCSYDGNKYQCINDDNGIGITGIVPTNTSYWKLCTLSIKNNVITNRNEAADYDLMFESSTMGVLFDIDRNDFLSYGDTAKIYWGSTTYKMSNFKSSTGKCANCLEVNPLTISDTNLRLQASSPLIGQGDVGHASSLYHNFYGKYLNKDYDTTAIPLNTSYDIGAFQYNSGYVPPGNPYVWPNTHVKCNWDTALISNAVVCSTKTRKGRMEAWDSLYTESQWKINDSSTIGINVKDTLYFRNNNGKRKIVFRTGR